MQGKGKKESKGRGADIKFDDDSEEDLNLDELAENIPDTKTLKRWYSRHVATTLMSRSDWRIRRRRGDRSGQ